MSSEPNANDTDAPQTLKVEVAYALPNRQMILTVEVEQGTTAEQAVQQSGITQHFPDLDLASVNLGIWGKVLKGKESPDQYVMKDGERIEIYRALIADPKEARRKRAEKAKESTDDS